MSAVGNSTQTPQAHSTLGYHSRKAKPSRIWKYFSCLSSRSEDLLSEMADEPCVHLPVARSLTYPNSDCPTSKQLSPPATNKVNHEQSNGEASLAEDEVGGISVLPLMPEVALSPNLPVQPATVLPDQVLADSTASADPNMDEITEAMHNTDVCSPSVDGTEATAQLVDSDLEKAIKKQQFIIEELISTENDYVRDLGLVVDGYIAEMKSEQLPENMDGKDKMVFGNIHQIYEWHRDSFQKELEKCRDCPSHIAEVFLNYEKRLYMYVKYCENKPKSDTLVSEFNDYFEGLRTKLGQRLMLRDLLIKPVQRIMKYQLLLKDLLRYTEKAGMDTKQMQRAYHVMCIVPKAADDMMNVGRLQGFNGRLTAQGRLLLQETLKVSQESRELKQEDKKSQERRVFLFEQIVIFSEEEKPKDALSSPEYHFKGSLQVNNMYLDEQESASEPVFTLIDRTPGKDLKVNLMAPSEEVKKHWVLKIKSLLDMQNDFLLALQSPIIYQKELTKELSAPDISGQGKSSLRKTISQPSSQKNTTKKFLNPGPAAEAVSKNWSHLKGSGDHRQKPSSSEQINKQPSPKPKRTLLEGFRNTLRPKKADRSTVNKEKNVGPDDWLEGLSVYLLADFVAEREEEISVPKNCTVHVLAVRGNMAHVRVPAQQPALPPSHGWVPTSLLIHKDSE